MELPCRSGNVFGKFDFCVLKMEKYGKLSPELCLDGGVLVQIVQIITHPFAQMIEKHLLPQTSKITKVIVVGHKAYTLFWGSS